MELSRILFIFLLCIFFQAEGKNTPSHPQGDSISKMLQKKKKKSYNPLHYKTVRLRVLEKSTGIKKDTLFSQKHKERHILGLTIKCHAAFIEHINPSLPVLFTYLEIFQDDIEDECIVLYADWYNNLKPVFENPDYDIEIMEIIP